MIASKSSDRVVWGIIILGLLTLFVLSKDHFLFWDTVQFGSAHPSYFFDTNFQSFWLPAALDSGHPPFFGRYIAFCWKLFGRSLLVTHLAMWPVVIGIVWQLYRLAKRIIPRFSPWVVLLLLLEPVLLGQLTLISPDLILVFAFLLGVNEIQSANKRFLIVAIILLGMISTRGMMIAFVLFLWYAFSDSDQNSIWKKLGYFIPGGIVGGGFLLLHYFEFGWIGYYEGSSWAESFQKVGLKGLARNLTLIGIHLLDFGHIFVFAIIGWTSFKFWDTIKKDEVIRSLVILIVLLAIFLLPTLIIHQYLFNHRYLLPIFLLVDFLAIYMVFIFWIRKKQGAFFLGAMLLVGSLWVYPQPIATSWDCTIMHWGYYSSRERMMEYISKEKIPLSKIGTAFPNINSRKRIDLIDEEQSFLPKDLESQQWIFYSNVMNDFSEKELHQLSDHFNMIKEIKSGLVRCQLFKKK